MTNATREPLTKLRPGAKTRVRNYFTPTPISWLGQGFFYGRYAGVPALGTATAARRRRRLYPSVPALGSATAAHPSATIRGRPGAWEGPAAHRRQTCRCLAVGTMLEISARHTGSAKAPLADISSISISDRGRIGSMSCQDILKKRQREKWC